MGGSSCTRPLPSTKETLAVNSTASRDRTKWRCRLGAFSAIPCRTNRRLLDSPLRDRSRGPDQVLEEGTIVHHGLPHVFCRNRMASMFLDDRSRGAVVHDDIRVVHRDVLDALLEVANGISASLHDVPDQPIGLEHRPGRLIDESRLDLLPFVGESPRLFCGQRGDVKTRGLGPPDIAGIPDCTVVLRTIPWAQPIAPPISDRHRRRDNHSQGEDYGNNEDDDHELLLIHSSSTSADCWSHTGYAISAGSSGEPMPGFGCETKVRDRLLGVNAALKRRNSELQGGDVQVLRRVKSSSADLKTSPQLSIVCEAYRLGRRAHSERGWVSWDVE